ncbi:hypothetical protein HER10_EVM0011438 [Colletotrichum scovillei]|uniref:uncharacterized protein n=1 Tax=Colletotrichum scovillei TaxID=1209932 RepID=UPI0015C3EFEC|nr:uncharacterized protein HER10_EVM0011438 [Colletotrichum scovillei]KAF4777091.1 hypothetical protein HER10_EVM0011438 [Colletotrichum scovillei]
MSGSSYYQRPAPSYSQYSTSANTGGQRRDTPANQASYTTTSYSRSSDPMDRFWVTGQSSARPNRVAGQMEQWNRQWSSASRR